MSHSAHPKKSTRPRTSRSRTRARTRIFAAALACGIALGMNTSPLLTHASDATGIEIPQLWEDHASTPISLNKALEGFSQTSPPLSTDNALGHSLINTSAAAKKADNSDTDKTNDADKTVPTKTSDTARIRQLQAILDGGITQNFTTSAGTFYVPLEGRTAPSGMALIGVRGTFVTASSGQNLDTAIAHINEIRKDAYESGLVDRYAPISRAPALERTAQIRAVEATVYPGHTRPNGKESSSISADGFAANGLECIAWGGRTLHAAIDQWAAEKQNYINAKNGKNTGETGHYATMINPDNTYVGLGMFTYSSGYGTTIVGRFSSTNPSGPSGNLSGDVIQGIYVPASAVPAGVQEFPLQSSAIGSQAVFSATTRVLNARALIESEIKK